MLGGQSPAPTIDLGVGAALGGTKEVGRRLAAGRAAMATFPKDVTELEEVARQPRLGGAGAGLRWRGRGVRHRRQDGEEGVN